jgi:GTP-binding protein HflX
LAAGETPLAELQALAESAGAEVVGRLHQNLRAIHPATYIGAGKAEELSRMAKASKARCLLFDHDLSPAQGRNLDRLTGVKVMDRTDLILDIFASRAQTRQAKVQVNLAMCEYRLPRLRRLWTHLEKQEGGIGMRGGAGERQLETDRRMVQKQIRDLRRELAEIAQRQERQVRARKDRFLISLVGYTNAGKSTLMRALTGEAVPIHDQLFVTLDTRTAELRLGGGFNALLSDTVGFIRRLPHHLVASFYATLEEARNADLLLHVVDLSAPQAREQMMAVEQVLQQVGCADRPVLPVFNKCDAVRPEQEIELHQLRREFPGARFISALRGEGLEELKSAVQERARADAAPVRMRVHSGNGKLLAFLATRFFEERRDLDGNWMLLTGRAAPAVIERAAGDGAVIVNA